MCSWGLQVPQEPEPGRFHCRSHFWSLFWQRTQLLPTLPGGRGTSCLKPMRPGPLGPSQRPSEFPETKPCPSSFSGCLSDAELEWVPQAQLLEHGDYGWESTFSLQHEKMYCFSDFPTGIIHGKCSVTEKQFSLGDIWKTVCLLRGKS